MYQSAVQRPPTEKLYQYSHQGVSLVEILLILSLLSITILPFTLLISQNAQLSRGVYIQSTRSLFQSSAASQMDPLRPDYYSQFNNAAMTTTLKESGQTIPYMAQVDTANSDTFRKTAYLYTYNDPTDTINSPRTLHRLFQGMDTFRLNCGSSNAAIDSRRELWLGDGNAYDNSKKQPGYVTGSSGTTGSSIASILNTTGVDKTIFQSYREGTGGTNLDYKFDVPNGDYLVSLYFVELDATVTGSSPKRRLMDIYIEGSLQNSTPYSPYETTGGTYKVNLQPFKVTVNDGVLDISIRKNASSNYDARISGIIIQKRLIKG